MFTMLANIAHHQPSSGAAVKLFDEGHMPPGRVGQRDRVVVAVPGPMETVGGKLVPLLTSHFAGLAADTQGRVGEEPGWLLSCRWLRRAERVCSIRYKLRDIEAHMPCPSG